MQNIAGKKRVRLEDVDSDYLFVNSTCSLVFVQTKLPLQNIAGHSGYSDPSLLGRSSCSGSSEPARVACGFYAGAIGLSEKKFAPGAPVEVQVSF
jgi:hypothetical protein